MRNFGNMQTLIDSLPQAIRYSEMITSKDKEGNKKIDFDLLPRPNLINSERNIKLENKFEQEVYGFNLECFLTTPFEKKEKIADIKDNQTIEVVALVEYIKKIRSKDRNMGVVTMSDSSATIEAFSFSETFKFIVNTNKGIIVKAKLTRRKKDNKIIYQLASPWEVINE